MQFRLVALVLGLLALIGPLSGCAGSATVGQDDPTGVYTAAYARAQGALQIVVTEQGTVSLVLDDDTAGMFVGSGELTPSQTFAIVCDGPGGAGVTVRGTFFANAAGPGFSGSIAGAFNVPGYSATVPPPLGHEPFLDGTYFGIVSGYESGGIMGSIDATGKFTGTINFHGPEDVQLTGSIDSSGNATLSANVDGKDMQFTGEFQPRPAGMTGSGTYTMGQGQDGTWMMVKPD